MTTAVLYTAHDYYNVEMEKRRRKEEEKPVGTYAEYSVDDVSTSKTIKYTYKDNSNNNNNNIY